MSDYQPNEVSVDAHLGFSEFGGEPVAQPVRGKVTYNVTTGEVEVTVNGKVVPSGL